MVQNCRYVISMPVKDLIIIQKMEFLLLKKKIPLIEQAVSSVNLKLLSWLKSCARQLQAFTGHFLLAERKNFLDNYYPHFTGSVRGIDLETLRQSCFCSSQTYNYTTFFTWRKGASMNSGSNSGSLWSSSEAACKKVKYAWYFSITESWQYWFFWNNHRQYF